MDAVSAARRAKVTVATIRTWCRIGAVEARKVGGRWLVDAASLMRRLNIGASLAAVRDRRREQSTTARAAGQTQISRPRRHRTVRCECASGRYGGVCTCC